MSHQGPIVPSIELQTVEFVEEARASGVARDARLRFHGFRVELAYALTTAHSDEGSPVLRDGLVLFDVYVPPRYRRRGWFLAYLKLCETLACDSVVIADLHGPVRDALVKRGYVARSPKWLVKYT